MHPPSLDTLSMSSHSSTQTTSHYRHIFTDSNSWIPPPASSAMMCQKQSPISSSSVANSPPNVTRAIRCDRALDLSILRNRKLFPALYSYIRDTNRFKDSFGNLSPVANMQMWWTSFYSPPFFISLFSFFFSIFSSSVLYLLILILSLSIPIILSLSISFLPTTLHTHVFPESLPHQIVHIMQSNPLSYYNSSSPT